MELLKKFFPLSFNRNDTGKDLAIGIIVYVVAAIISGLIIFLATMITSWIPAVGSIVGWSLGTVGGLIELYVAAGIVIRILHFTKVIKD